MTGEPTVVNVLWIPAAVLLVAAVIDQRTHKVSDGFPLAIVVLAIAFQSLDLIAVGWVAMVYGALLALAIGALMSRGGGIGSGDVLLLGAIGFLLGPLPFLVCLVFISIVGGTIGVLARVRGQAELAYGPAIATGYVLFLLAMEVCREIAAEVA